MSASRDGPITCCKSESLVELPAHVAGYDDLIGHGGGPGQEVVSQPLIKNVTRKRKHRAIDADIVTVCDGADITQMIGESFVDALRVEISELGDIGETQLETEYSRIVFRLPDKNSIAVLIFVRLLSCGIAEVLTLPLLPAEPAACPMG